ncbi:MAG: hypothetical protein AAFU79_24510, partial [Myxococcota bacterium]
MLFRDGRTGASIPKAAYSLGGDTIQQADEDGVVQIARTDLGHLYSATPDYLVERIDVDPAADLTQVHDLEPDTYLQGVVENIPSWMPESELAVDLRFGRSLDRTAESIARRLRTQRSDGDVVGGRFSIPLSLAAASEAVLVWRPDDAPPEP